MNGVASRELIGRRLLGGLSITVLSICGEVGLSDCGLLVYQFEVCLRNKNRKTLRSEIGLQIAGEDECHSPESTIIYPQKT